MRITDLPELSVADLAENDVVAVDHDTGNGIETRRFRVGKALADKLDKSGGDMTGYMNFCKTSKGLSWTCNNGDIYRIRTYAEGNVFQITRQNPNGLKEYGVLNVYEDGRVTTSFHGSNEAVMNYGIVASGENYIRYGNGKQICWTNSAIGAQSSNWIYPVAFAETPAVIFQAFGNDQNFLDVVVGDETSSTNAKYFAFRNTAGNYAAYGVHAIAIGRWK